MSRRRNGGFGRPSGWYEEKPRKRWPTNDVVLPSCEYGAKLEKRWPKTDAEMNRLKEERRLARQRRLELVHGPTAAERAEIADVLDPQVGGLRNQTLEAMTAQERAELAASLRPQVGEDVAKKVRRLAEGAAEFAEFEKALVEAGEKEHSARCKEARLREDERERLRREWAHDLLEEQWAVSEKQDRIHRIKCGCRVYSSRSSPSSSKESASQHLFRMGFGLDVIRSQAVSSRCSPTVPHQRKFHPCRAGIASRRCGSCRRGGFIPHKRILDAGKEGN